MTDGRMNRATMLAIGSVVVAMSSGAALRGSPLSGGWAGAKAMVTTEKDLVKLAVFREELALQCFGLRMRVAADTGFDDSILTALRTWQPAAK